MRLLVPLARVNAGRSSAVRMPTTAMTTSNSSRVKPRRGWGLVLISGSTPFVLCHLRRAPTQVNHAETDRPENKSQADDGDFAAPPVCSAGGSDGKLAPAPDVRLGGADIG